jgi:putative transposase
MLRWVLLRTGGCVQSDPVLESRAGTVSTLAIFVRNRGAEVPIRARMPRRGRAITPGSLVHVVSNFAAHAWFMNSNGERSRYLELLGKAMQHSDWKCLAYCLIKDQVQLAMIAGEHPLESWAKRVNSPFAQWLNKKYGRMGALFADRPKTAEMPSNQAFALIASIHTEPVRAKLVLRAAQCDWSSHRAYSGLDAPPDFLHVAEGLALSGFSGSKTGFDKAVDGSAWLRRPPRRSTARRPDNPKPTFTNDMILRVVAARFSLPTEALSRRYARGSASEAKNMAVHVARARRTARSDSVRDVRVASASFAHGDGSLRSTARIGRRDRPVLAQRSRRCAVASLARDWSA